MKLNLTDTTLIAVTTRDYAELRDAIARCELHATFNNVVVFTDDLDEFPGRERIQVKKMSCREDVSVINLTDMVRWRHRYSRYTLNIHTDSWIVNPDAWSDEFREYDYIGAAWHFGTVGNDGFGWKSHRFWEVLSHLPLVPTVECCHPADVVMCLNKWEQKPQLRCYRKFLETRMRLKWAPVDVANKFSVEDREYKGSFGFHGPFTIDTLRTQRRFVSIAPPNKDKPKCL